ncbi:MAG: 30S ribosomal protein S7 [Chloroflexi bacterium]|nr:30S ribosomal protein S7 [Chloroflexota bacterium]
MSRRSQATQRIISPDAKYHNVIVAKVINRIMTRGKKSRAEEIVYGALAAIAEQESKDPAALLEQAIKNVTPQLEVKSRRIGGANYQVPVEVRPARSLSLAIRWLITSARARPGKSMMEKLAGEVSDAAKGQGVTVKKRDDTHRMAEANRAFAHYRW